MRAVAVGANKVVVVEGGREVGGTVINGDSGGSVLCAGIVDTAVCFIIHSHTNGTWSH